MTLLGIIVGAMLLVVVVGTVIDVLRQPYSAPATVGWIALALFLPFIGSAIYWFAARKPEPVDADNAYLLETERRRESARRPLGP